MLNLAINSNGGGKITNNQLKAVAATVTKMAMMTAMTMAIKVKVTALLMAAWRWQWQRACDSKSAAEAGSAAAR